MYGCGLFRREGIVGGTLITINKSADFKQNHTPVKRPFLNSIHHARLLGFTQVCGCVYICVCTHVAMNITDKQYSNNCLEFCLKNHTKYLSQLDERSRANGRKIISGPVWWLLINWWTICYKWYCYDVTLLLNWIYNVLSPTLTSVYIIQLHLSIIMCSVCFHHLS